MIGLADSILQVLAKTLEIWDWHNKTKYSRKYKELLDKIALEESKPIYGDFHYTKLRDQSKIDHWHRDLKLLMDRFLKDEANK